MTAPSGLSFPSFLRRPGQVRSGQVRSGLEHDDGAVGAVVPVIPAAPGQVRSGQVRSG